MKKLLALSLSLILTLTMSLALPAIAEERVDYNPGEGWITSSEMLELIQAVTPRTVSWIFCREDMDTGNFTLEVQYESGKDQIFLHSYDVMIVLRANGEQTVDYSIDAVAHVLGFVAQGKL